MVTCPENPPSKYLAVACTRRPLTRMRNASPRSMFLPEMRNGMIDLRTAPVDDPGYDRLAPRGYASHAIGRTPARLDRESQHNRASMPAPRLNAPHPSPPTFS